ncbi:MAG: hypothetical protein DI552_00245 [Brevundimonas sp.]|uniref:hypothetical protein n=1 Tax=Brevundimonas sp. TaxID=1871086 RepID=UPI000DBBC3EA|nr:hypothetical protein [Brevundimonas sp.]PZU62334.1 MAG: hypothetical protein DI552_00245 [Brevundimonas sp.]
MIPGQRYKGPRPVGGKGRKGRKAPVAPTETDVARWRKLAAKAAVVAADPLGDAPASPTAPEPAKDARDLVLRVLTVRRIARWCDVGESAVHQWLHRGTEDAPVPAARVPIIAGNAAAEGLSFDVGLLWPAMAGTPAAAFKSIAANAVREVAQ